MPLGAFRLNTISQAIATIVYNNRQGYAFTPTTGATLLSTTLRLAATTDNLKTTIPHTVIANNSNWTVYGRVKFDDVNYTGYRTLYSTPNLTISARGFGSGNIVIEYYITDNAGANAVNWNGNLNGAAGTCVNNTYYTWSVNHYNNGFYIMGNGASTSTRTGYSANYTVYGSSTGVDTTQMGGGFVGNLDDITVSDVARMPSNFVGNIGSAYNDDRTISNYQFTGTDGTQAFTDTTTAGSIRYAYINGQADNVGSATITMPDSAKVDDVAVFFDTSTSTTLVAPSGWTQVITNTTTGIRTSIFYKRLVSGDLGSTITGMSGTTRKVLLVFTPNIATATLTVSAASNQATTATPTAQNLVIGTQTVPLIGFAVGSATGSPNITFTGSTQVSSVSTSGVRVNYRVWNFGDTLTNTSVSMTDAGTNILQSFYLKFT